MVIADSFTRRRFRIKRGTKMTIHKDNPDNPFCTLDNETVYCCQECVYHYHTDDGATCWLDNHEKCEWLDMRPELWNGYDCGFTSKRKDILD